MAFFRGFIAFATICALGFAQPGFAFQSSSQPFNWEDFSNQYLIRNYKVEDGLPVNSVNFALHHTDGFMYFATNDGLVKYDGMEFTILNTGTHPQLQNNRIASLQSGINNELWILDKQNSLFKLKDGNISAVYISDESIGKRLHTFEILSSGHPVLGTNEGLLRINESGEFIAIENTQERIIESAVFNDQVYFLTEDGLFQFNGTSVSILIGAEDLRLAVDQIQKMKFTSDGTLWMPGTNGLLTEVAPNGEQIVHQYNNNILMRDITELNSGELLIISNREYVTFNRNEENFAVYQLTEQGSGVYINTAMDFGFSETVTKETQIIFVNRKEVLNTSRRILHVTADREGSLWVATNGEGVFQILKKRMITIGENNFSGFKNIYGLDWSDEALWVSTFENGIYKIEESSVENWNRSTMGEGFNLFRSITTQKEKIIAGNFGIWVYENNKWIRPRGLSIDNERIDVIFTGSNQQTWIGTNSGLYLYNNGSTSTFIDSDSNSVSSVRKISETDTGQLLIATGQQGLAILNEENVFSYIKTDDGLSSNSVRDVYVSAKDTLWVVTEDRGLNRVILNENDEVSQIKILRKSDGLLDNSLHRLIEDEFGYFWINSNSGIMRINKHSLNRFIDGVEKTLFLRSFGLNDGLENLEGNGGVQNAGLITDDGRLLFPNQAGLIYTRPEWHISESVNIPEPPVVETVFVADSIINVNNSRVLVIRKGQRDIQLKLTLPTFVSPDRLSLEYLLEDVNSDWQKVSGDRMAVFTNIPPGAHNLKIRGSLFGDRGFSEANFIIDVPPYFYETIWFKIVLGIASLGLFLTGIRISIRRYKKRETILNELVDERTEQLLEEKEKTEQALKKVQEIDRSKSQFFTNFTHELRTPLSLILGPLEDMIERKHVSENKDDENLLLMRRNADRLKELVNQLLDVSKLSAGELTLTFESVDLLNLTKHIVSQFEHAADKKSITIKVEGPENLPEVYVDVTAWNHICTNLLSNAIKYTNEGDRIDVELKQLGAFLEFSVNDNGMGIEAQDLPHIFDAYYQGKNKINRTGGTGIGLALTKGMVEQMNGIIDVESRKGKGSRFTILLSLGKKHIRSHHEILDHNKSFVQTDVETKPQIKDEFDSPKTTSNLGSAKVLLVEDNEDFRNYLKSIISEEYDVEVAPNGKEGLNVLEKFRPDIVVSDIMMPKMNGFEMMKEIRANELYQHMPFIFLSAKDSEFDMETGLNLGADIYLTKPVSNRVLLTQLKVLLRREKGITLRESEANDQEYSNFKRDILEIINRHLGNPDLNVELIANAMSVSATSLYRNWKKENDETLNTLISRLRFEEAIKLIREEQLTISEAAFSVGFNHLSYFSKSFKKMYRVPPQEYLSQLKIENE